MFRKNNLTVAIIFFVLFFSSVISFAQVDEKYPKNPEEIARKITDRIQDELQLSGTQYDQVYEIFVKHITQAHSGSISVESSPGKGSVFKMSLPQ